MMPSRTQKDVVLVKLEMLGDTMVDPNEYTHRQYFFQACYREHAFKTIVKEINESDKTPSEVVHEFKKRMEEAACNSWNSGFMFSVAADTADWIIDTLCL